VFASAGVLRQDDIMSSDVAPPRLPHFEVEFAAPDLAAWLEGNTGIPGFTRFTGPEPGPHVAIIALTHGNEIAGAVALDALLRGGPRPLRGRLTLGFANLDAFAQFDPAQPTGSRFVDEDMNRLWDETTLDGPRQSRELTRARAIRPLLADVDILLDLHSMLWPSDPLILCGPTARGRALATQIATPPLIVADTGHAGGRRLIDYAPFTDPNGTRTAILVESGQHWETPTIARAEATIAALLGATGLAAPAPPPASPPRCAEVSVAVTAGSTGFTFVQPFRGGDVVARRNTLIAVDGDTDIRTPHDDCLLVMPSLRPGRGQTAVRLARFV
jgi:predicted deacylase